MADTQTQSNAQALPEGVFFSRKMLTHPAFKQGMQDMFALAPGFGAWALVTGVAMVKAGMPAGWAVLMNIFVNAGSAQLAALPLMLSNAPLIVILIAATCVNLRFAIFSIQWRPYLLRFPFWPRMFAGFLCGDLMYVLFMKRFPSSVWREDQMPYFWGLLLVSVVVWQGMAMIGIALADFIPMNWGIEFAAILAILAVVYSMLGDWITWLTMIVVALAVVCLKFVLPLDLNIVVGILAGLAAALVAEKADFACRQRKLQEETVQTSSVAQGENHEH